MALPFGSTLEARVYRALLAAGWQPDQIRVQTPVLGGRSQKGGLVVDFILYTPLEIPIVVNGEYWHKNREEELLMEAKLLRVFDQDPIILWGDEAQTDEAALATVIRKIGRAF